MKKYKIRIDIKTIIVVALILRLLSVWFMSSPKTDDVANAYHTLMAWKNKQFTFFQPNAGSLQGAEPLYRYFLIALYALGFRTILSMKIATILISLVSIYVIYLIGKVSFSEKTGKTAAILASVHPDWIVMNTLLWRMNLQILLFLLGLYFFIKERYTYSAVLMSLSVYTYTSSLLLPGLLLMLFLFVFGKNFYKNQDLQRFLAVFIITLLPFGYFALQRENSGITIESSFSLDFTSNINAKFFERWNFPDNDLALYNVENIFGNSLLRFDRKIFTIFLLVFDSILWIMSSLFLVRHTYNKDKKVITIWVVTLFSFAIILFGKHADSKIAFITSIFFIAASEGLKEVKFGKYFLCLLLFLGLTSLFFHGHIIWRSYGMDEAADTIINKYARDKVLLFVYPDEQMDKHLLWRLRDFPIFVESPKYPYLGYSTIISEDINRKRFFIRVSEKGCSLYVAWAGLQTDSILKRYNFKVIKNIYWKDVNIVNIYEKCADEVKSV